MPQGLKADSPAAHIGTAHAPQQTKIGFAGDPAEAVPLHRTHSDANIPYLLSGLQISPSRRTCSSLQELKKIWMASFVAGEPSLLLTGMTPEEVIEDS